MQRNVPHPQIDVGLVFEIFLFPVPEPTFLDGLNHIFGVGVDRDRDAIFLNGFQPLDYRQQLHAVVGGKAEAFRQLFFGVVEFQYDTVTTRPGIALCGTIGIYTDHQSGSTLVLKIFTLMARRITPNTLRKTAKPDFPTTRSSQDADRKTP